MQKSTVFLLVIALASAGVSAGLWMQLRAERALNAELSERLNVVAASPPAPVLPAAADATFPVAPPSAAPVAAAVPIPSPAEIETRKATRATYEDWRTRQRRLMSDPKFREAYREQERLRLATRRDNFVRLLGFSPEQADTVIDLSIERQMDSQARMSSGEMTADEMQQRNERMETDEREYQAKLRDLLGGTKAAQLETYMESRQTRMQVDRFRVQLGGADPLREDQVEPLIAALHAEQAQMRKDVQEYGATGHPEGDATAVRRQNAERQTDAMKAAHQRMHSAAAGILSSSQLEKLDAMLKRDLERHEAQQRMSRIQSKFEPPSEPESPPR
jgi:ribulose bisphosphate carboxylase small subunit